GSRVAGGPWSFLPHRDLGAAPATRAPRRALLRHHHFEDAALQARGDAGGVDGFGQLDAALEGAVAALEAQVAALATGRAPGARELDEAAVGVELHVLAAHAGKLGVEDEGVAGFHE